MNRKEYELIYNAFKHYRVFMDDEQEVMSEKILDDLFYPHFDKLEGIQELDFKTGSDNLVGV
tara:strand:- start:591 stop:776 length:186 start_codon:yes stop_codon:yes gene_type:complete